MKAAPGRGKESLIRFELATNRVEGGKQGWRRPTGNRWRLTFGLVQHTLV